MKSKLTAIGLSILLICSIFAATPVAAQEDSGESIPEPHTKYIVTHNTETGESTVQLEVRISEPSKYADWSLSWSIPESATIEEVRTTSSDTVSKERNGEDIKFIEDDGSARNSETFYVTYTTDKFLAKTDIYGINQYEVTASALPEKDSYIEITFEGEEIANAIRYSNHSLKVEENTFTASGSGPPSFYINTMDDPPIQETDDYAVYGKELPKDKLDNSYAISTIATGVIPQFKQVPLIILSESEYDNRFSTGSEGQFSAGIIYLSEEATTEGRLLPILTHEYTHAVTQRIEPTSPSRWFTEGASEYTESIALEKVGRPQNEIDTDQLRDYESNGEDWVTTSSWDSFSENQNKFAYYYTQLLFKYKESQTPSNFMHQLYKDMATDSVNVDENTSPTVLYGDDWNGKVCEKPTPEETDSCVRETMEFVPELEQPEEYTTPFDGEPQKQEINYEETETDSGEFSDNQDSPRQLLDKIIDAIQRFFESDIVQNILQALADLLNGLVNS